MEQKDIEKEKAFQKFLEEQGPSPASGFFGNWAWKEKKRQEFEKKQRKEKK